MNLFKTTLNEDILDSYGGPSQARLQTASVCMKRQGLQALMGETEK